MWPTPGCSLWGYNIKKEVVPVVLLLLKGVLHSLKVKHG